MGDLRHVVSPPGLALLCESRCECPHFPGPSKRLKSQTPHLLDKFIETSWDLGPVENRDESNPVYGNYENNTANKCFETERDIIRM